MFCVGGLRRRPASARSSGAESGSAGRWPTRPLPLALVSLVRRNRRRYGGYIVHLGIVVLLVGVAASTSFQHVNQLGLKVGQSAKVAGYTIHYVRSTAYVTPASDVAHTGATLTLGAVLKVTKGGHYVATLEPSAGLLPLE